MRQKHELLLLLLSGEITSSVGLQALRTYMIQWLSVQIMYTSQQRMSVMN